VISLMMELLYESTLKFPPKSSTKKLESRGKLGSQPSAWAPELEDEVEDGPTACYNVELHPVPRNIVPRKLVMSHAFVEEAEENVLETD
jgi:hypothetical protein